MVRSAAIAKEIAVRIINKIGVLADVSGILSECGINIEAVNGYAVKNIATIMILTNDNLRAVEALKKAGYTDSKEKEVVIIELENKIGSLKDITAKLAEEEIDISHIYATVCSGGCPAKIVLSTNNNEKTLAIFKGCH
jgi:hypothetical protein